MKLSHVALTLLFAALGCSSVVDVDGYVHLSDGSPVLCDPPPPGACASEGMGYFFVYSSGDIGRVRSPGVADGFDLDGTAVAVCRQPDFVSPDGDVGVDNQFAPLIGPLEMLGGIDIEEISRMNILQGMGLRVAELTGVDDLVNDPCVTLELRDAELPAGVTPDMLDRAPPMGWIDPGLTFDFTRPTALDGLACIRDGRLYAQFPDLVTRLEIGDAAPEVVIQRNRLSARVEQLADGSVALVQGVSGGSVDSEEVYSGFMEALGTSIRSVVLPDLDPDALGRCQSVSTAFTFETAPAVAGAPID